MKQIIFPMLMMLSITTLKSQCEFPRNNGTNQYQGAIEYRGDLYGMRNAATQFIVWVNVSELGFKKNLLGDSLLTDRRHGEWLVKWNYSNRPNRWQPMRVDCDAFRIIIDSQDVPNGFLANAELEVDFFYIDRVNKVSATYTGTFRRKASDIFTRGKKNIAPITHAAHSVRP